MQCNERESRGRHRLEITVTIPKTNIEPAPDTFADVTGAN
jgi:hypothetical protein